MLWSYSSLQKQNHIVYSIFYSVILLKISVEVVQLLKRCRFYFKIRTLVMYFYCLSNGKKANFSSKEK